MGFRLFHRNGTKNKISGSHWQRKTRNIKSCQKGTPKKQENIIIKDSGVQIYCLQKKSVILKIWICYRQPLPRIFNKHTVWVYILKYKIFIISHTKTSKMLFHTLLVLWSWVSELQHLMNINSNKCIKKMFIFQKTRIILFCILPKIHPKSPVSFLYNI